jgi:hypothetical protein
MSMSKTNTLPKIEKGIPVPKAWETGTTDLLRSMEIGDSVLVPRKDARVMQIVSRREKMKVTVRKASATEARVWRIA